MPTVFAGRGDGTFAGGYPFAASGNSGYFAIADFTGSGLFGLAAGNQLYNGSVPTAGSVVILPRAVWPSPFFTNVSAAGFGLGPLASGSVASGFGTLNIQPPFGAAPGGTAPSIDGNIVSVTGSDGVPLPADLYYISPGQVNYVIPPNAPAGLATVHVSSAGSVVASGQIDIAPVAPNLFTANANDLAAAYVTRVSPSGQQTYQLVYQADANGNIVPLPIDLSSSTDKFYLTILGTGIRNNRTPIGTIANIGSIHDVQVTFAGPQGSYEGVDQVNILLPSGPGSPLVSATPLSPVLQLIVGGQPSNRVTFTVQ